MVAGNVIPASLHVRLLLVFLSVRRVFSHGGRVLGSGRLKPVSPFLSLLHVKVQRSPPVLVAFTSVSLLLIVFMVLIFYI